MSAPAEFQVRRLEDGDSLEELTDLLHRAYAALGQMGFNYTAVDQSVSTTRERIGAKECYVGFVAGRMLGTLVLGTQGVRQSACKWYSRPGVWIVGQFGVDPACQGRGIGTRMLTFAEERARSQGALEVAVDTAEDATHLVGFYTARGYRHVDYVHWEGKNYRSLVLSKPLRIERTDSREL